MTEKQRNISLKWIKRKKYCQNLPLSDRLVTNYAGGMKSFVIYPLIIIKTKRASASGSPCTSLMSICSFYARVWKAKGQCERVSVVLQSKGGKAVENKGKKKAK